MGNLIKCPMCDKDISPNAISCPHCGEPMKPEQEKEVQVIEKPTSYNLILESTSQAIKTIKLIREVTNLGLKEAKDITDKMPCTFMFNLDIAKANSIVSRFKDVGAVVTILGDNNTFIKPTYVAKDNLIKCSNCKSVNCNKISGLSKAGSVGLWGIFSVGKLNMTWECKSCGYRW